MSYQDVYREENEAAKERFALVMERISQISGQPETDGNTADYFKRTAAYILLTGQVLKLQQDGMIVGRSLEECEDLNRRLYADLQPHADEYGAGYENSYANPAYAVRQLGEGFGGLLSFLYTECLALGAYAFEGRIMDMTILMELYVEIYTCFCDREGTTTEEIRRILYWNFHDYSEIIVTHNIRESNDT